MTELFFCQLVVVCLTIIQDVSLYPLKIEMHITVGRGWLWPGAASVVSSYPRIQNRKGAWYKVYVGPMCRSFLVYSKFQTR